MLVLSVRNFGTHYLTNVKAFYSCVQANTIHAYNGLGELSCDLITSPVHWWSRLLQGQQILVLMILELPQCCWQYCWYKIGIPHCHCKIHPAGRHWIQTQPLVQCRLLKESTVAKHVCYSSGLQYTIQCIMIACIISWYRICVFIIQYVNFSVLLYTVRTIELLIK